MSMHNSDSEVYYPGDRLHLFDETLDEFLFHDQLNGPNSDDTYPFSPIIETCFGPITGTSLTGSHFLHFNDLDPTSSQTPNRLCSEPIACNSEANWDEVPMDLVTSDEESEVVSTSCAMVPNPSSVIALEQENSTLNDLRRNCTTELDEAELRSRALRSLLLKNQDTGQISEVLQDCIIMESITTEKQVLLCKKLSIGSGRGALKTRSKQKFVISLDDSSDSDIPDSSTDNTPPVVTATKNTTIPQPPSVPTIVQQPTEKNEIRKDTNKSDSSKLDPGSSSNDNQLLRLRMNLLRIKLTTKRQERLVEERRKLARKLLHELNDLRKRAKCTSELYKEATRSLSQAEKTNAVHQKELLLTQRNYIQMSSSLKEPKSSNLVKPTRSIVKSPPLNIVKPPRSIVKSPQLNIVKPPRSTTMQPSITTTQYPVSDRQRKDLMAHSINILQHARITTAYFAYYQFDCANAKVKPLMEVSPNVTVTHTLAPIKINTGEQLDPAIPLCPFLLDGECRDANCRFQHPAMLSDKKTPPSKPSNLTCQPISIDPPVGVASVIDSPNVDCSMCKMTSSNATQFAQTQLLQKWHTVHTKYQRCITRATLARFCQESLELVRQSGALDIVEHHLTVLCSNDGDQRNENIVEALKITNFPISACRLVFNHSHLSSTTRRSLARTSMDNLFTIMNSTDSSDVISPTANAFIYIAYHFTRLSFEAGACDVASKLLDGWLSTMSKEYIARCGLWWLRLSMVLFDTFPTEDVLFSVMNLPLLNKTALQTHRTLIQSALTDLNIPDQSLELVNSVPDSGFSVQIFNSYLALLYVHVQQLLLDNQSETVARLCLSLSVAPSLHTSDDLFYPIAIHSLAQKSNIVDWSNVINCLPESEKQHVKLTTSFRIEFGFLLACSAWQKNKLADARSFLIEPLASLIFLPSDDDAAVINTFQELLGIYGMDEPPQPDNLLELFCVRGHTYLWLSYVLYSLMFTNDLHAVLHHIVAFYRTLQTDPSTWEYKVVFTRLLLNMIIILMNRICDSPVDYAKYLSSMLLETPIPLDRTILPSWLIEVIQRINIALLPSPGIRHDVCVNLVEHYGYRLIPSFCRCLIALNDRFLAQSLCTIARMDLPTQSDFWLLFASLNLSQTMEETSARGNNQGITLVELFSDAVAAAPACHVLWKQYAVAIQASGLPTKEFIWRAKDFDVHDLVSSTDKKDSCISTPSFNKSCRSNPTSTPIQTPTLNRKIKKKYNKRKSLVTSTKIPLVIT